MVITQCLLIWSQLRLQRPVCILRRVLKELDSIFVFGSSETGDHFVIVFSAATSAELSTSLGVLFGAD
jgi:hypothetical protein